MHKSLIFFAALILLSSAAKLSSREARFLLDLFNVIRLNPASKFIMGLLMGVPVSIFTPDDFLFTNKDERSFGGRDAPGWPFKPPRPLSTYPTCPSRVASLEEYLRMLRIEREDCQELFICEISKNPQHFMPLSNVLLKKLALYGTSPPINSNGQYLLEASQVGMDSLQECRKRYRECPVAVTSMVNMNFLRGWQFLSQFVNLRFVAETDADLQRNY